MSHRFHNSFDPACKMPFGAVEAGQTVTVRLFLSPGQSYYAPLLLIFEADRWQQPAATVGLEYECTTSEGSRCLRGRFTPPFAGLYFYCFQLTLEGKRVRILKGEKGEGVVSNQGGLWQLTVTQPGFITPDRYKGGIMYQIFPDRFCRGDLSAKQCPAGRQLRADWGGLPKYLPDADGEYRPNDFFGGDLKGIQDKLPYLKSLGVTAIYLNPIFEAHSNHRYNTADYRKIDPLLGDEKDFAALCAEAKRQGISVILDGVFSHTGSDSVYFNREGRYPGKGAWQGPESPYFNWYHFYQYPDGYDSWWGFKTLPEVKENCPDYMEFICGEDGVLHKWMDLGAGGWRLDVADELPDAFLDRLRSSVKQKDPDALVLGEVWEDASCKEAYGVRRRYLLGDQLDSVMNYPFREAILDFAVNRDGEKFMLRVLEVLDHYPKCVCDVLMNFLSTHDVERAITCLAGEPCNGRDRRWQSRHHRLNQEQYRIGTQLLRIADLLQYTLPGIPCVYYGDEAGLSGYRDPFNRCCYPWGREDTELVEFFKALGAFRTGQKLLAKGRLIPLQSSFNCCRYLRVEDSSALFVAVNAGEEECGLPMPREFTPDGGQFVAGRWDGAALRLGGRSGVLLTGKVQTLTFYPQEAEDGAQKAYYLY